MYQIITLIARYKYQLAAFNLLIAALGIGKLIFAPRIWVAEAELILPNNNGNLDANLGTLGSLESGGVNFTNTLDPLKSQKSILNSNPVLQKVYETDPQREKFSRLSQYKKIFDVSIAEKSNTLDLSVNTSDYELALKRAEKWIEAYQERLNELRQEDISSRQKFNEKQIKEARERLNQADNRLAEFKKSFGLVNTDEQTKGMIKVISDLTSLQQQAKAKAEANQKQINIISHRLSLTPSEAILSLSLGEDKDYQFIKNKLVQVEVALSELQANFTNEEPRVQELLLEKEELKRQLRQRVDETSGEINVDKIDTTISSDTQGRANLIQQLVLLESEAELNRKQAEQLQTQIEQISKNLQSIPENQAQLVKLEREKNIAQGIYQGLIAQVQQVNINSFDTYPNVQVIDPPQTDSKPTSPDKKLIVLSSLLASMVGSTALVLLLETGNPLLDPSDLQSNNFPIVVCIPKFKTSDSAVKIPSQVQIEFEKLASAICRQPRQNNRFLITSSYEAEGKTTTTIGLALALKKLGFKVLIVDGDYHKAELSKLLNYSELNLNIDGRPIEIKPNLYLLAAKPQQDNIAAFVPKGQFEQNLIKAESFDQYDYILIDTPPISLTSETILMSSAISNLLFVVRSGISQRNIVQTSLEQLAQNGAYPIGLIVNDVKTHAGEYSYRSNLYLTSSSKNLSQTSIN